ncbi:hypothetical protein RHMOL_Rhmol07G0050800 [Rhododendron molle]|uniref:Uncharacterized protein n=1 Tax=Rhododendron molle TaxID=49168 RepID=A0ACC0MX72_RHOML|nr:hypothetical protein RHMOL_Rhmol07G0050800 [Rhododendron molle]
MEVAGKQSGGEMESKAAWWVERARKIGNAVAKEGREDPRKVVHSVKVGMAVTVASMVYLLEPLFHGMGRNNSLWAVLTVILILEFTAGATFYKGINRGIGTLAALSFALLIEIVARHAGHIGCAISIGFSVFLTACVEEYFQVPDTKDASKSSKSTALEKSYEEIFQCNSTEESLATFASWEPRHSRYCYPWKQYVHLGTVLRRLAYTAFALHGCLGSHVQAPQTVRALFKEPCEHVAKEIVKVLSELAETIKKHQHFSAHISDHLHEALEELDASIKTQPQLFLTSNQQKLKQPSLLRFLGRKYGGQNSSR